MIFKDYIWNVSEPEYRADEAISYSMISKFLREGYQSVPVIKESLSTASLTLGSALDCLVTEGSEAYDQKYYISQYNPVNKTESVIEEIYKVSEAPNLHFAIETLGEGYLSQIFDMLDFYKGRTLKYKVSVIEEKSDYYEQLINARKLGKTIINESVNADTIKMYNSMVLNSITNDLFFIQHKGTEKFFQAKFRTIIQDTPFRCMFDLLVVNHEKKVIVPVDLKTTSTPLYDFYSSFIKWNYQIQVRLYTLILKNVLKGTEYENYRITDYLYTVVNKNFSTPVVYSIPINNTVGDLEIDGVLFEDPIKIGEQLYKELLRNKDSVKEFPIHIDPNKINNLFKNKTIKILN